MKRLILVTALLLLLLVACSREQRLVYLDEGELYLWEEGSEQAEHFIDRDDVGEFFFSPSGRHVAYLVEKPYSEPFWCYADLEEAGEIKTRSRPLFSGAGHTVASIKSRDDRLILMEEGGGGRIDVAEWVQGAQWNSAGDQLAYIEEGDLKVFELETMSSRFLSSQALAGPDFVADDLVLFLTEDNTLAAAATDGEGVFRLVEETREYYIPRDRSGLVRGERLVCVDIDRDAYLMDFDGGERRRTGTDTYRVVWDHDGSRFFLIERKRGDYLLNIYAATGERLLEHEEPWSRRAADTLCWSWISDELAFINKHGELQVLDLNGQTRLLSEDVLELAWVPNERRLLVLEPRAAADEEAVTLEEGAVEELEEPEDDETAPTEQDSAVPPEDAGSGEGGDAPTIEEDAAALEETVTETAVEADAVDAEQAAPSPDPASPVYLATLRPDKRLHDFPPPLEETLPTLADDDETEPPEYAVYLYSLEPEGGPRQLIARTDHLPLSSPDGRFLLYTERLTDELFNLNLYSLDENSPGELFLGKVPLERPAAAWQPAGRAAEGNFSEALLTIVLIVAGGVLLLILIRSYIRHRRQDELRRKLERQRRLEERDAVL
jgi:hypothetical protein